SSASATCTFTPSRRAARSRSISIASTFPARRRVRAPSPGPISTKKSSLRGAISSIKRASTRGSCRKCWPNLLRGLCEVDGKLHRLDEAGRVRFPLAGDVERGAVVDRSAHERQAERDVHAAAEALVLQDRQALIVEHGEHRIGAFQALGNEE